MASDLPDNVGSLTVAKLKVELKERGLSIKGKKADFVQRLTEWQQSQQQEEQQEPEEIAPEETAPEETAPVETAPEESTPEETAEPEDKHSELQGSHDAKVAALDETNSTLSIAEAAGKAEAERVEAERVEAERVKAERVEAERVEAERVQAERVEAERVEDERVAKMAKEYEEQAQAQLQVMNAAKLKALEELEAQLAETARLQAEQEALLQLQSEQKQTNSKDKKKKHKKKKKRGYNEPTQPKLPSTPVQDVIDPKDVVTIEYVSETSEELKQSVEFQAEFDFEKFSIEKQEDEEEKAEDVKETDESKNSDDEDDDEDDDDEETNKMSKKKLRKQNRLTVSELKQLVARPDVVEIHDVTAADPKLLVLLKAARNTVPIPKHWAQKRKYLQGKRGIEKPPFVLPEYIVKTGIMEMREALAEKEERMGLKAKSREKTRPKMGKIDIDYEKLHDAFFRYQTKPKMSMHGELYYEGKEFETKSIDKKPGDLSDELRAALGMPVGEAAAPIPPPWLLHMQRYGPPPSYPNLKIPGLNARLPEDAKFGYHAGGWGKPPVDEYGRPLYGDVFATSVDETDGAEVAEVAEEVSKDVWGELESEEEESSDEEESDAENEDGETPTADNTEGTATPSGYTSETPSGITSVQTGTDSVDALELRKKRQIEDAMDDTTEQSLYKVLPQQATMTGGMMGSQHIYDMATAGAKKPAKKPAETDGSGIEMSAANPDDIENMDQEALQQKYAEMEAAQNEGKDDFSDMVAQHTATAAKKRKAQNKKDKDVTKKFKF